MPNHLIIVFFLATLVTATTKEWKVGNASFPWEDGWRQTADVEFTRLLAPGPTAAAVTIDLLDRESPIANPISYAKSTLPRLAKRHGRIVQPLKQEKLESGAILFSVSCYDQSRGKFGIIFVHITPKGRMGQFALEGQ